ncbi:HNH endonuclease [Bacillus sp. Wb]
MKECVVCNKIKPLDTFYTQKKYSKKRGEWIYYNPECKDCTKERSTAWRKKPENREAFLESRKRMNQRPNRRREIIAAREKIKKEGYQRKYYAENKEKFKFYRIMHSKHTITKEEWEACKQYFDNSCAYCGISEEEHKKIHNQTLHKEHVDHNGSGDITNCVPACKSCNSQKWIFTLEEWYSESNEHYDINKLIKINKWITTDSLNYQVES